MTTAAQMSWQPPAATMASQPPMSAWPGMQSAAIDTSQWAQLQNRPESSGPPQQQGEGSDVDPFQLADRKVRLTGQVSGELPLYVLCRRWVQNDADGEADPEPPAAAGADSGPLAGLPAPAPKSDAEWQLEASAPSVDPLEGEDHGWIPPAETLLAHNLTHWRAVKQHASTQHQLKLQRYQEHFSALLAAPPPPLASNVAIPGSAAAGPGDGDGSAAGTGSRPQQASQQQPGPPAGRGFSMTGLMQAPLGDAAAESARGQGTHPNGTV